MKSYAVKEMIGYNGGYTGGFVSAYEVRHHMEWEEESERQLNNSDIYWKY